MLLQEERWSSVVPLKVPLPFLLLHTDMPQTGWGVHLRDLNAAGTWTPCEKKLHTSILEMKAVQLALNASEGRIKGEDLVLISDSATVVA